MNEKSYKRKFTHVYQYNKYDIPQKKLRPTTLEIPEYTFFGVPFRYLSKDCCSYLDERFPYFEKDEEPPFSSGWTFGRQRQYDILNQISLLENHWSHSIVKMEIQ